MEEDKDFDLLKDDVMTDNIDGIQAVSFSSKVIKLKEKIMDKAIVTKLLDRGIGLSNLYNKIHIKVAGLEGKKESSRSQWDFKCIRDSKFYLKLKR
ncbi:hypothetical protein Golob_007572 [Gossypium lobatum]|uniref:Uncharacterized protein n=1 Tax=Gossypium lobatum TaxID=34289 RepID=A0A7J8MD31_9ROSI|nr:hypothetical protein [Gossypium lobatum]